MSILRQHDYGSEQQYRSVPPPYRPGDRIPAVDPDNGASLLLRVERVSADAHGRFRLVAAVISPRRLRSHVVTLTVDTKGVGPGIAGHRSGAEPESGNH
jgi:hypothetical protein